MHLYPGSAIAGSLKRIHVVPAYLQHFQLEGFYPTVLEGDGFSLLCQHYEHPEVDIYLYHIQTESSIHLFSKAETHRWVMGFLQKGEIKGLLYNGQSFFMPVSSVLFYPNMVGKENRFDLVQGHYHIVCCCFKPVFETVLTRFYSSLIDAKTVYHVLISPIGYAAKHVWEGMSVKGACDVLYDAFLSERIRVLLRYLCQAYLTMLVQSDFAQLHPGVEMSVVEKAYQVKGIIDGNPGDSLQLTVLARKTGWNLQGLKTGFLQVFGISTHQYIIQYRMQVAYDLLLNDEALSIQAIALHLGYKQSHHFIRQFKVFYGKTPGEVRRGE